VHDPHLYVGLEGSIWRIPLSGGMATRVTNHLEVADRTIDMLVDGDHLYFTAYYPNSIRRVPLSGSLPAVEEVISDASAGYGLAVDESAVYFVRYDASRVYQLARVLKSDIGQTTTPDVMLTGLDKPGAVELIGDDLYVATDTRILRVPKTASVQNPGDEVEVHDFGKEIVTMTTDGCFLVAVVGTPSGQDGELWRMRLDATERTMLMSGIDNRQVAVAIDARALFVSGIGGIFRFAL
jgi:hypothetical protein